MLKISKKKIIYIYIKKKEKLIRGETFDQLSTIWSTAQNDCVVNHCDPWIIWKYSSLYHYCLQCTVTFNSNTEWLNWIIKKLKSQTVCLVAVLVHFAESSALELGCVQKAKLFPARSEPFYITITEWPMENARTRHPFADVQINKPL